MNLQTMSFLFGALLLAVGILGGGFEVKEIKISNVSTSVRILAGLVGLFFIVMGFWQPGALTGVMPAAATMSEREHDKDRFGGDYSGFDVTTDHIELCEDTCKTDSKCFAWTYVKPGIQASQARCYLKSVVPAISNNACCVSGTKIR
jgi:PAN domain